MMPSNDALPGSLPLAAPADLTPPGAARPSARPPLRVRLIARLKAKHAELEGRITEELTRPRPDFRALHALKRERLALKDRLAALARTGCGPSPRRA